MEEKLEVALKDIQIFFMQAEIEKRYDKQLTDYFLKCHAIIESALKDCTIQNTILKEHEKELIAEQHRLFDLAKEQENELQKIKEQYKNIEEELGIDLITLFKALKNGVYWKGSGIFSPKKIGIYFEEKPELDIENKMLRHILYQHNIDNVKLKDYGKTWALTEEELRR